MESFLADKQNEAILKKINLASFAININFDDYNSYCRRSALYESLGLFKLSLDDAVKAISIDRAKDDAYIHQAKAFAGLKKYAEAEKSLNDCLAITRNKRDLILSQLEHLRYLAVKQIGFSEQICALVSKQFGTIKDAENNAFTMDEEEAAKSDGQANSANIISNLVVNSNPNLNNSSNSARNTTRFEANNQDQTLNGQQQQDSSQISQAVQLNDSNQITSNPIGQLTSSQVNHHVSHQMNNRTSDPVNVEQLTGQSDHLNSQSNQLTGQLMSNNQPPISHCHSATIIQQFTNPNLFLSSSSGNKSIYASANSLISAANTSSMISTIANTQHYLTNQQHLLNQHENPSSTVLDNTPLSEMDLQQDGTDFSSDMQMWTESEMQSEMQVRSDNSDQTLIINSNRSLPQFTTPSKDFLSDLNNDLFLSSPFTNNNSNSSVGFGDSLTTPQFNRKDLNTRHQAKKQRVIKNLMNDLADHSSPLYEHSPCPETSPFSNISSVQSINTPKSNVIVSPRQSPLKQATSHMDNLDDLDDLDNSINRADGNSSSMNQNHSPEESNQLNGEDKSVEQDGNTKSASEEKKEVEILQTVQNQANKPLTNQPLNIIITGINSLNNPNGLIGPASGSVIKSSAQYPILLQSIPLQFQVNQYRGPTVQPLPMVTTSKEPQITYLNCPITSQKQQQQSHLEELIKEHNIEIVDTETTENCLPANNVSNPNKPPIASQQPRNPLSITAANSLGNFVSPLGASSDGSLALPSNPASSASPNHFTSTDLQPVQPVVTDRRRKVAKLTVKPPILLRPINKENALSNCKAVLIGKLAKTNENDSKPTKCLTRRQAIGEQLIKNNDRTKRYKLNEKKSSSEPDEEESEGSET